jgi:hypothetical protein
MAKTNPPKDVIEAVQYALWYNDLCDVKKIDPQVISNALTWLSDNKPDVIIQWLQSAKSANRKEAKKNLKINVQLEPHSRKCAGVKHLEKVGMYRPYNFYCTCGADDRNIEKLKNAKTKSV